VRRWQTLAALVLVLLAACTSTHRAPVEDRGSAAGPGIFNTATPGGQYRVVEGDTVYSIAWRYGLDYRRLAAANGITAPYTIRQGQMIALREADPGLAAADRGQVGVIPPTIPAGGSAGGAIAYPTGPAARSRPTQPSSPVATPLPGPGPSPRGVDPLPAPAGTPATPVPVAPPERLATTTPPPVVAVPPMPVTVGSGDWSWPGNGPVLRGFSSGSGPKGIDIGGTRGDPVTAVAAGTVVYSGSGIPGYGQLLIIKHSETYLSAYAHNDRLLVDEGASVAPGQRIADMGSSGTNSVKLHFQIRRDGKPIDPLPLLPRR